MTLRATALLLLAAALAACNTRPLFRDTFTRGTGDYVVEMEKAGSVSATRGFLDINTEGGCTVWLNKELAGPVEITYTVTPIKAGGKWDQPCMTAALHTDAQCTQTDGQPGTLNIQVVRAQSNSKYWHGVSKTGGSEGSAAPTQMADELRDAISKKESRIPEGARPDLVLVLSALDSPAHAFDDVITVFRSSHGEWASRLGFEQIWVVGPSLLLTHRVA